MALVMKLRQAARLREGSLSRFHALDGVGAPLCMSIIKPPVYPVDYDNMLGVEWVPVDQRCRRWGCSEAWAVVDRGQPIC